MSNSSIWPIDRTLSGVTTQGRMDLGAKVTKGYSAFLKAPALQEHHNQIALSHIKNTCCGGGGEVLLFCKDVVGVFYSIPTSRLG